MDEELKMLKEYKKLAEELIEEQAKAIKIRDDIIALRESQIKKLHEIIDMYKKEDAD